MFSSVCRCSSNLLKTSATATTTAGSVQLTQRTGPPAAAAAAAILANGTSTLSKTLNQPLHTLAETHHKLVNLLDPTSSKFSNSTSTNKMASTSKAVLSKSESPTSSPTSDFSNRLATESSPYLLQHAHNPVDWYPWGEEAFARARLENKLIFLSVGYSTCHWCHVMERESFENVAVAKLMNDKFINVKVDREERPDVDQIYMRFLTRMRGSGGWPMNIWLTPDLTPVAGGSYFPPEQRWGMPAFRDLIQSMAAKWLSDPDSLKECGMKMINGINTGIDKHNQMFIANVEIIESDRSKCMKHMEKSFKFALNYYCHTTDERYGGFGDRPKFPEVPSLNFLFHAYIVDRSDRLQEIVIHTLNQIGKGGIHDHVFGGFARYTVDRQWHVPHFEKMLYDQGQLMSVYANAYKLTRNETFLRYADGIFRYIMEDLRDPKGGFYSGEDADSLPIDAPAGGVKMEGAFYVWTLDEISEILLAEPIEDLPDGWTMERVIELYAHHYDVKEEGNVNVLDDPHDHFAEQCILIVRGSEQETANHFSLDEAELRRLLQACNRRLKEKRSERPRPQLDIKVICAWNGLVLSGISMLANCGSAKRPEYMQAAADLVEFIRKNLYDADEGTLRRTYYGKEKLSDNSNESPPVIDGFLCDYAFLIRGLLDYHSASLDEKALQWARQLQDVQDKLFWDNTNAGYFYSQKNTANLVIRLKEDRDGAEPAANSVSARNLILLSHYFDDEAYNERAFKLLAYFSENNIHFAHTMPEMASAFLLQENGLNLVAVVGPQSEQTDNFLEICRKFYIPGMIIIRIDPAEKETPSEPSPLATYRQRIQDKFKMINDQATVYMCQDRVCRMPLTDPEALEKYLNENYVIREQNENE